MFALNLPKHLFPPRGAARGNNPLPPYLSNLNPPLLPYQICAFSLRTLLRPPDPAGRLISRPSLFRFSALASIWARLPPPFSPPRPLRHPPRLLLVRSSSSHPLVEGGQCLSVGFHLCLTAPVVAAARWSGAGELGLLSVGIASVRGSDQFVSGMPAHQRRRSSSLGRGSNLSFQVSFKNAELLFPPHFVPKTEFFSNRIVHRWCTSRWRDESLNLYFEPCSSSAAGDVAFFLSGGRGDSFDLW